MAFQIYTRKQLKALNRELITKYVRYEDKLFSSADESKSSVEKDWALFNNEKNVRFEHLGSGIYFNEVQKQHLLTKNHKNHIEKDAPFESFSWFW